MYELMQAHPVSVIVVTAAMMVTPLYVLCTYAMSGASAQRGAIIGTGFLIWGAITTWLCLSDQVRQLEAAGGLIVLASWVMPSVVLLLGRKWFLERPLSQRWLIGLQIWRAIGGVFLIEMSRGHIPGIFAYPAGLGDIAVAIVAVVALLASRGRATVSGKWVVVVLVLGVLDFLSAFFFGFFSSQGPQQLFEPEITNNMLQYPTGLIPLFLVPYAIFFHMLSLLTLMRSRSS